MAKANALTPMMRQYFEVKEQYPDCLLLYRLGDFYELFFDDALTASKELEITLTGRDCGLESRAPMCGVPFHAVDSYVSKLIDKGYKVAICEQLEDPATAKGVVKRGVIRVITPGTVTENSMLSENENNYILSCVQMDQKIGIAYADVSTGAFYVSEVDDALGFFNEMTRVDPSEVLYAPNMKDYLSELKQNLRFTAPSEEYFAWAYEPDQAEKAIFEHFHIASLSAFDLEGKRPAVSAAGALLQFLHDTQKNSLEHINKIIQIQKNTHMTIDGFTRRNLELVETIREKSKKGSLLWLLDNTKTSMGARLLRSYIEQPLTDLLAINARLEAVDELKKDLYLRAELQKNFGCVYDIERLLSRISYMSLDAKNCIALKQSIAVLPAISDLLANVSAPLLKQYCADLDSMEDLYSFLDECIAPDPPVGITDGGIIKSGYNEEVDKLRESSKNGRDWIAKLEAQEREKTGIKNLKIGFNKVFGYYFDVTRSNLHLVPYGYIRKQTLSGSERFITQELKDLEDQILNADEKCIKLEYSLFVEIREKLTGYIERLQKVAQVIAQLDVLQSLAQAAFDNHYVRPQMSQDGEIEILDGRHPVVEKSIKDGFVPNDTKMNNGEDRFLIITGPNMAGKSTFMRQIGLIVLMAHIGSFVPARSAKICIVDRIFTRVGASDDIAAGQSTFMVEMNELALILNNATQNSLLILDEIGRGTSTLDGLSIAWACVEYLSNTNRLPAKTLFATHYHELVGLEGEIPGVKNYSVTVKEYGDEIIFMHKIRRGGTDRSFGIEVAKLAGLPEELLSRAKEILNQLEKQAHLDIGSVHDAPEKDMTSAEKTEVSPELKEIGEQLRSTDINALTPIQAINLIDEWKRKIE